jgi:DNA-binding CsgD family transcriptional regulator
MGLAEYVQACGDTAAPEEQWLRRVTGSAAHLLGSHRDLGGYTYRVDAAGRAEIERLHPDHGQAAFLRQVNATGLRYAFSDGAPRAFLLSRLEPAEYTRLQAVLPPGGVDSLGLLSGLFQGTGVNLCCLYDQVQRPALRQWRLLKTLAEHLSAGYRQRCALRAMASITDAPDVVARAGRGFHTNSELGERRPELAARLVAAVQARERLQGERQQRTAREPAALFQAFVAGEYTLIDSLEDDGKRWIVAMRGDSERAGGLTQRQRTVVLAAAAGNCNRTIALELGVAERTVTSCLRVALRRLGIPDRQALGHWLGQLRAAGAFR